MLKDAIERNQRRQARFKKYERVLRRIRQRIFDYEDAGKLAKATHVMERCKTILAPFWQAHADARQKAQTDRMMRTWE